LQVQGAFWRLLFFISRSHHVVFVFVSWSCFFFCFLFCFVLVISASRASGAGSAAPCAAPCPLQPCQMDRCAHGASAAQPASGRASERVRRRPAMSARTQLRVFLVYIYIYIQYNERWDNVRDRIFFLRMIIFCLKKKEFLCMHDVPSSRTARGRSPPLSRSG
jgi:hypothetical protein